ncbi:hypothetical protein PSTG_01551 [Puccinia striiformis f. sp. tritici PST-78]|uniref:Uncharacterized protein n=1 Tax=Puccinia striiformis f. sp. tritici PST-78 TaxID=1165861 RepID=A0A0L0W231_9BASI|nr:hypothetical protein PSTG_01551 [Puccinia striiformis f. sp. tritici PST-78]
MKINGNRPLRPDSGRCDGLVTLLVGIWGMMAAGQSARPSEGHLQALVEIESVNLAAHHSVMDIEFPCAQVRDTERTVVKYSQMSLEVRM